MPEPTQQSLDVVAEMARISRDLNRHIGTKPAARTMSHPHSNLISVVEALTRVTASREREFQFVGVKAVAGSSASILYVCLGDNSNPTTFSWVQVATG